MTHLKHFASVLLVAAFTLLAKPAKAQSIIDREYLAAAGSFPATDIIHITDDQLTLLTAGTSSGVFRDKEAYALVSVGIDPDMNLCYDEALKFKVTVKSEETVIAPPGPVNTYTNFYTLTVNYDPALQQLEAENAFVKITNGRELKLSITEVKLVAPNGTETTVGSPSSLPGDLFVEGELIRERYYNYNPLLGTSIPAFYDPSPTEVESFLVNDHVHVIQWTNVLGAAEYEVEWTYVNAYGTSAYNTAVIPTEPFSFRNNASSVRVKKAAVNRFFIPAIYGNGYVVFRVRAIGRGGPGLDEDIFGQWSLNAPSYTMDDIIDFSTTSFRESITNNSYNTLIQEEYNLNAQFSVQFAEEGKMMVSSTFADGTLRIRQNVATVKVYDDQAYGKKAMITETIYDHMGRPAVSTLPAVTKNGIWYTPNYNLDDATLEKFDYTHFDLDEFLEEGCVSTASPMSPTSGASQYYSSSNLDKAEGHQGLIADAFKFPYTQVLYERDNTARPIVQSGPGVYHKMGSGHESKSVYGSAEQVELNRLFGTDVGLANYYQKTMATDANGQISVTYTDMLGHTIATALTGQVPPNMDALLDQSGNPLAQGGENITEDLLHKSSANPHGAANTFSQDGTSYTYTGSILVTSKQVYHFSYATEVGDFEDDCFPGCMDCVYDLELALIDNCGSYLIGNNNLDGPLKITIGSTELDMICNDSLSFGPLNFNIELEVGSYSIYKKLSINEAAMEAYADSMLRTSTCLLPPSGFYDTPDLSGCDITCEQCMEGIGTWEDFFTDARIDELGGDSIYAEMILSQVYASMKADCEAICADETRDYCAAAYELMLMDMSPQGQYAGFVDNAGVMSSDDILSIFNPINLLPKKFPAQFAVPSSVLNAIDNQVPSWRLPVFYDPLSSTPYLRGYYTDNGQRVTLHVYKDANGDYVPAVLDEAQVVEVSPATNSYYTYPENLLNLSDFISVFQPHYAKSLLIWHPEFFHYEWCGSTYQYTTTVDNEEVNTHNFDRKLANMSLAEAQTYFGTGSITPVSVSDLMDLFMDNDPFFQNPLATVSLFPGINPTSMLTTRLNIFEVVIPTVGIPQVTNFAQMAHVVGHCPLTGQCVNSIMSFPAWGSGSPTTDLIASDQDWKRVVDFYTSSKQYMFGISQNLYAMYADDPLNYSQWPKVNTQCIGNNTYVPIDELLEWAANPASLIVESPCNALTFPFYYQKQRRFFQNSAGAVYDEFGLSDPPTMEELQEYSQQAYYQQTGKCMIVADLELILNKLSAEDKLTTTIPIDLGNGYIGSTLYKYIETDGNPAYLSYAAGITSNTLTAVTSAVDCNNLFTLSLPSAAISAGYTFSDIIYLSSINNIQKLGSIYTFEMQAIFVQPGTAIAETLAVTGSTCLPLQGCSSAFKNICKPTPESKDLLNLLSALSHANQLYGSAVDLNASPYNVLITPRLQQYLGAGGTYTWTYGTSSPDEYFELKNTTNSNVIRLDVPSGSNGLNPVSAYEFIAAASATTVTTGNAFTDFIFTATPINPSDPNPYQSQIPNAPKVTLTGTVSTVMASNAQNFLVTECNPVTPLQCNTPEHKNLDELKEVFELWVSMPGSTPEQVENDCFSNLKLDGNSFSIANIAEILETEANMALSDNNINSHYFRIRVRLTNNTVGYITGHSCYALRNCETCVSACEQVTFKVSFPDNFTPNPGSIYQVQWDCADYQKSLEYTHASPEEFWQEMADNINQDIALQSNSTAVAYVQDGVFILTYSKSEIDACPCGAGYNSISIHEGKMNGDEFDSQAIIATYPSLCCDDLTFTCIPGSSYLQFTVDQPIENGHTLKLEGGFWDHCFTINPSNLQYNHFSTHAYLQDWANQLNANHANELAVTVIGNSIYLNFAPGVLGECLCGNGDEVTLNQYNSNDGIVWHQNAPLLCCQTPPSCQPGGSHITYYYTGDGNPGQSSHQLVLQGESANCFAITPNTFPYDGTLPISDVLTNWATQITASNGGLVTASAAGNRIELFYAPGALGECKCSGNLGGILAEIEGSENILWQYNAQLECCPTPCDEEGGFITLVIDPGQLPVGGRIELVPDPMYSGCLNLQPSAAAVYNGPSISAYLNDWATQIGIDHPGSISASAYGNTLIIYYSGVLLTDCPCSEHPSITLYQYDDQDKETFSQNYGMACCGVEDPKSRSVTGNRNPLARGNEGPVQRAEEEEETFSNWEPWPQFTENTTDCHPEVVPFPRDTLVPNPCIEYLLQTAAVGAQFNYAAYLAQKREEYKQMYREHCMQAIETFDMGYKESQYHYTLYYYDRAGNLVKTVPPHAVTPLTGTPLASVNNARATNTVLTPDHNSLTTNDVFKLTTRYRYNSLNQPIAQQTPDGGQSTYWYDRLGRLALSQNAEQNFTSTTGQYVFSYTLYDALSRITEVGEMTNQYNPTGQAYINQSSTYNNFFLSGSYTATDVTQTKYDATAGTSFLQENLRSRVSYVRHKPKGQTTFPFTDYYTYDYHGNVKSVLHENLLIPAAPLQKNQVDYAYDLISGKANRVTYNAGKPDQYIHQYAYDDQNRLTHVYTSRNGLKFDLDGRYFYYWHGPLARTELGQNKIQGQDYAYSIQGWLKSINSDALRVNADPAHDGDNTLLNPNRYFARDAYGLSLHYFVGDYTPIESGYTQLPALPSGYRPNLWNGNIGAMNNTIRHPEDFSEMSLLQGFTYDQLNRITSSTAYNALDVDNNLWASTVTPLAEYATTYKYDPAGNIKFLTRTGETGPMDDLVYHYPGSSNQLQQVTDNPAYDANYTVDIDNQTNTDNYWYDKIGNLTKDKHEEIDKIEWNPYGKVTKVTRESISTKPDLEFMYDAGGRRIMKKTIPKTDAPVKTEYYVHDASGNILSIYTYTEETEEIEATYIVNEQLIYGSSRLGSWKSNLDLLTYISPSPEIQTITRGEKRYELSNHLGNVHSVVSDRKNRICDEGVFLNYEADIRNTYDYYPFGMLMPGRTFDAPPVIWEGCDTIQDSVQVMLYEADFNSSPTSWTIFDDGHTWYLFSSEDPTQVNDGQLALHHHHYDGTANTLYLIADAGLTPPTLQEDETYYYEFDIETGNCGGLDSLVFGVDDLNGSSTYHSQNVDAGGHFSGSFTANATDAYYVAFALYGNDTCTAYMDNFKMWRYKDTTYVDCSGGPTYTTLFEDDFNIDYHDYGWGNYYSNGTMDGTTAATGGYMFSDERTLSTAKFFTTETGQKYRITIVIPSDYFDCTPSLNVTFGENVQETHAITAPGTYTFEWTAPDADGAIIFDLSDCDILLVDNVLVEEVEESEDLLTQGYRFGFNGQEKDDEVYGEGNAYTAEYWEYDPRIGRRWNMDPMTSSYPSQSSYATFNNSPIRYKDPSGLQGDDVIKGVWNESQKRYDMRKISDKYGPNVIVAHFEGGRLNGRTQVISGVSAMRFKEQHSSYSSSPGFVLASTFLNALDQGYNTWSEHDYDHKTYVTNKGNRIDIPDKANKRSLVADKAVTKSQTIKGVGLSLNALTLVVSYAQVYDQYNETGSVNPVDALSAANGTVGLAANVVSYLGYGGAAATSIANASTILGFGILAYSEWYMFYQMIYEFEKYNTPTTNNPDEAEWNRKMWDQGVRNEGDLYLIR